MKRRLNSTFGVVIVLVAFAQLSYASPVGEQSSSSSSPFSQGPFALPESFSNLIQIADSFDSSGTIKAGSSGVSPTVGAAPSSQAQAASSNNSPSQTPSIKEGEKALTPKTITPVGTIPTTGEVVANDNRYGSNTANGFFGGSAEPSVGTLFSNLGTGNAKSLSDTLSPVAGSSLSLSNTLPGLSAPKATGAGTSGKAGAKDAKAGSKPDDKKDVTDKDVLPGTPGDPNVGKASFGNRSGDALPLSDKDAEEKEKEEAEKARKEKEKEEQNKQESQEEKDKRQQELKDVLSGEVSLANYEKLADQILNNREEVLESVKGEPELRNKAKQLIEKFKEQDRNLSRKAAADRFLSELDSQGALDGVQRPQVPPLERPVHNE